MGVTGHDVLAATKGVVAGRIGGAGEPVLRDDTVGAGIDLKECAVLSVRELVGEGHAGDAGELSRRLG
jgi:hypothetical protein